ncbi:MAG: hypothetical protein ILO10_03905 [Kiritimatiellae bacterium]|nr:hypothetical protein [Kiritimatiellia bacterium]
MKAISTRLRLPFDFLLCAHLSLLASTDLSLKRRDVEPLLLLRESASRVTDFPFFLYPL